MSIDSQSAGAEVLDRLKENLRGIGSIVLERSATELCVPAAPPEGFEVRMMLEHQAFTAGYGTLWHEHFGSAEEAIW